MQFIKKITIYRFRSIGSETIEVDDITVLSGQNNSGKSNILKALNLFFNYETKFGERYSYDVDYNKCFTGASGGKRDVKITIYFSPRGRSDLSKNFWVSKTFQSNSNVPTVEYFSEDDSINEKIKAKNGNTIRQFTLFLNKIQFLYIPAIRDAVFVKSLFTHFEDLIKTDASRARGFDVATKSLSSILEEKSKEISSDFSNFIEIPSRASLSANAKDILGNIQIKMQTQIQKPEKRKSHKIKNIEVDLMSSGDGILMTYIAYFIAHLSQKNKKYVIWGFEEPENSLEYSKVQLLADNFYNKFKKYAQIFITTHSPAFILLKEKKGVSFYRVYLETKEKKQLSRVKTIQEIQESLLNSNENYELLKSELYFVEQAADIEYLTKEFFQDRKKFEMEQEKYRRELEIFRKKNKPIILTEGDTDPIILRYAWKVLYQKECPYDFIPRSGAKELNSTLRQHIAPVNTIIGLFDADETGINQAAGLNFLQKSDNLYVKINDNYANIYALTLPVPDEKKQYKYHKIFEIENYFADEVLKLYADERYKIELDEQGQDVIINGNPQSVKVLIAKDKMKKKFATEVVPTLQENDFQLFKILFDKINSVIQEDNKETQVFY